MSAIDVKQFCLYLMQNSSQHCKNCKIRVKSSQNIEKIADHLFSRHERYLGGESLIDSQTNASLTSAFRKMPLLSLGVRSLITNLAKCGRSRTARGITIQRKRIYKISTLWTRKQTTAMFVDKWRRREKM